MDSTSATSSKTGGIAAHDYGKNGDWDTTYDQSTLENKAGNDSEFSESELEDLLQSMGITDMNEVSILKEHILAGGTTVSAEKLLAFFDRDNDGNIEKDEFTIIADIATDLKADGSDNANGMDDDAKFDALMGNDSAVDKLAEFFESNPNNGDDIMLNAESINNYMKEYNGLDSTGKSNAKILLSYAKELINAQGTDHDDRVQTVLDNIDAILNSTGGDVTIKDLPDASSNGAGQYDTGGGNGMGDYDTGGGDDSGFGQYNTPSTEDTTEPYTGTKDDAAQIGDYVTSDNRTTSDIKAIFDNIDGATDAEKITKATAIISAIITAYGISSTYIDKIAGEMATAYFTGTADEKGGVLSLLIDETDLTAYVEKRDAELTKAEEPGTEDTVEDDDSGITVDEPTAKTYLDKVLADGYNADTLKEEDVIAFAKSASANQIIEFMSKAEPGDIAILAANLTTSQIEEFMMGDSDKKLELFNALPPEKITELATDATPELIQSLMALGAEATQLITFVNGLPITAINEYLMGDDTDTQKQGLIVFMSTEKVEELAKTATPELIQKMMEFSETAIDKVDAFIQALPATGIDAFLRMEKAPEKITALTGKLTDTQIAEFMADADVAHKKELVANLTTAQINTFITNANDADTAALVGLLGNNQISALVTENGTNLDKVMENLTNDQISAFLADEAITDKKAFTEALTPDQIKTFIEGESATDRAPMKEKIVLLMKGYGFTDDTAAVGKSLDAVAETMAHSYTTNTEPANHDRLLGILDTEKGLQDHIGNFLTKDSTDEDLGNAMNGSGATGSFEIHSIIGYLDVDNQTEKDTRIKNILVKFGLDATEDAEIIQAYIDGLQGMSNEDIARTFADVDGQSITLKSIGDGITKLNNAKDATKGTNDLMSFTATDGATPTDITNEESLRSFLMDETTSTRANPFSLINLLNAAGVTENGDKIGVDSKLVRKLSKMTIDDIVTLLTHKTNDKANDTIIDDVATTDVVEGDPEAFDAKTIVAGVNDFMEIHNL